jgi:exopolyphosphatase/guanosine-5'-triphosphate,3'-diphosphate pyrophosphatase
LLTKIAPENSPKNSGPKWPSSVDELVGSSGTVKALSKITKKSLGKKNLSLSELRELISRMSRMNTTQLLGMPGMEAKRVDMILAGAILLEECMETFGAKRLKASAYSLRDGILIEQIELSRRHERSQIALHIPDLVDKAVRLGGDAKHLLQTLEVARILFKKLQIVHKLKPDWLLYLEAAVLLRNTGEAVSLIGHPQHSSYIVRNAKFPFIEEWESELVAELCRYHEVQKIDLAAMPFSGDRTRRQVFLKLLAILSLVDALDVDRRSVVAIKKVRIGLKDVRVAFAKGSSSDLEVFRTEQRRSVFEHVFRRSIHFAR